MEISVDNAKAQSNLMLFDDDNKNQTFSLNDKLINFFASMPYTDDGWLPKKVFIANRAAKETATFRYKFMGALALKSTLLTFLVITSYFS